MNDRNGNYRRSRDCFPLVPICKYGTVFGRLNRGKRIYTDEMLVSTHRRTEKRVKIILDLVCS